MLRFIQSLIFVFLDNIHIYYYIVEFLILVKQDYSFHSFIMGHKSTKHKKDLTHLSEEEVDRLTKNTTYSKQQIQDWHQGFLRYANEEKKKYFFFLNEINVHLSFRDCPNGKLDKKKFLEVYKVDSLLNNQY